jgi:hypothetical protein
LPQHKLQCGPFTCPLSSPTHSCSVTHSHIVCTHAMFSANRCKGTAQHGENHPSRFGRVHRKFLSSGKFPFFFFFSSFFSLAFEIFGCSPTTSVHIRSRVKLHVGVAHLLLRNCVWPRCCVGALLQVDGLIFGSDDYAASVGATRTSSASELLYARQAVITHAKAYGLQAIDMVNINYKVRRHWIWSPFFEMGGGGGLYELTD